MESSVLSELKGIWTNEIGSTLKVTELLADGCFKGTYESEVGKTEQSKPYCVVGCTSANLGCPKSCMVSFIVNWGEVHALTSWNGYLKVEDGKKLLQTTWLHTKSTKEVNFWDGLTTGSNFFVPKK